MKIIKLYRLIFEDGTKSDWTRDANFVIGYAKICGLEYEWIEREVV